MVYTCAVFNKIPFLIPHKKTRYVDYRKELLIIDRFC